MAASLTRIITRFGASGIRHALAPSASTPSSSSISHRFLISSLAQTRSLSLWASRFPSWASNNANVDWRSQSKTKSSSSSSSSCNSRILWYASSAFAVAMPVTAVKGLAEFSTMAAPGVDGSKGKKLDITLYQFEVCPFCNKVRAYLDYHNIPYRVVEVDPLRKTELKQFSADYRKVPIAIINDEQVNGSGNVIEAVESFVSSSTSVKKQSGDELEKEEAKWLKWLDDHFIHLIAPNIYRTPSESLQTFNYITDKSKFSWIQRASIRYTGAAAMYFIGRRLKKKYDIDDERKQMHDAIGTWMQAIHSGGSDFLNGQQTPGVVDLSMYGVLKAIETFDTFEEIRQQNQDFAGWYDRVKQLVGPSSKTIED